MNKRKLLTGIVLVLLIVNLFFIGYLIFNKKPMERGMRPREGGPQRMIVKKLNFDEAQQAAFQESIEEHQQKTRPLHEELQQVKRAYLLNQDQTSVSDSLSLRFGTIHSNLLKAHKEHFADIKQICKPEQMDAYNELMKNIGSAFGPPGQRRMKQ